MHEGVADFVLSRESDRKITMFTANSSARFVLLIAMLVASLAGRLAARQANTVTAASCSQAAVQAAIDGAVSGAVVVVPNGSCSWTGTVTISGKAIKLQGASQGGVLITHNSPSAPLLEIGESTGGLIEISQFSFVGGTGDRQATIRTNPTTGGRPILIHHNSWMGSISAIRAGTHRGVIFQNAMNANGLDRSFVQCQQQSLGLSDWESPHTIGTADTNGENNLYVEDNVITGVPLQAFDSDANCRIVIRYNTMAGSAITSHGPDTGPYGNRHTEVYNNTFTFDPGPDCWTLPTGAQDYFIFIRGGVWVVTDNVIPDLVSCALGNKGEIKMQIQNLRRNSGPMPCWAGGYPMPRQIGFGHNGAAYVPDPVYIWGNTGGGVPGSPALQDYSASPTECLAINGDPSIATYIQLNRDYLTVARPGYTKFRYPHPLRMARPSAPTSLRIVGVN